MISDLLPSNILTQVIYRTACCRSMVFSSTEANLYLSPRVGFSNEFRFHFNAKSETTLSVELSVKACAEGTMSSPPSILPNQFYFNGLAALEGSFQVVPKAVGCFIITGHPAGATSFEETSMEINILSDGAQIPQPRLIEAKFSNDGRRYGYKSK